MSAAARRGAIPPSRWTRVVSTSRREPSSSLTLTGPVDDSMVTVPSGLAYVVELSVRRAVTSTRAPDLAVSERAARVAVSASSEAAAGRASGRETAVFTAGPAASTAMRSRYTELRGRRTGSADTR